MFQVIANQTADHKRRGRITCTTCDLKGCVGRCRFEAVKSPQPSKAA